MTNDSLSTRGLALVVGIFFLFVILLTTTSYAITNQENTNNNNNNNKNKNNEIEDNKLNVVTSVAPITNIVQNIGGGKINLIGLIPEGVNSHTFELVPSDIIKINNADLIIIDGLNLEVSVEQAANNVIAKKSHIHILKLGEKP